MKTKMAENAGAFNTHTPRTTHGGPSDQIQSERVLLWVGEGEKEGEDI